MDFNQLLQESRQLESKIERLSAPATGAAPLSAPVAVAPVSYANLGMSGGVVRVPLLQRSLAQLDAASSSLLRQTQTVPLDAHSEAQAQIMLATKGIDLRKQERALKELEQSRAMTAAAAGLTGDRAQQLMVRGATGGPAAGAVPSGLEHFHPLDIERFLQQQQNIMTHAAMDEAARVTSSCFHRYESSALADDWEAAKREILDAIGFRAGKNALLAAQAAQMGTSAGEEMDQSIQQAQARHLPIPDRRTTGGASLALGMEQAVYARAVQELNHSRVKRNPTNLIDSMISASQQVDEFFAQSGTAGVGVASRGGLESGDIEDCWQVIKQMTREGMNPTSSRETTSAGISAIGGLLQEKHFASAYDADTSSTEFLKLQQQLIDGSKTYCERLFSSYMKRVVAAHPEVRMPQAKPSFVHLVSAYVRLISNQLPRKSKEVVLDGVPFWAQIFYCVRCGQIGAALELMHRAVEQGVSFGTSMGGAGTTVNAPGPRSTGAQSTLAGGGSASSQELSHAFVECMEKRALKERTFHTHLWNSLHEEYQRELASALNSARAQGGSSSHAPAFADPFKLALYLMLGRFKLPATFQHLISQVITPTTEDFVWFKLSLVVVDTSGVGSSSVGAASGGLDCLGVPDALRDHIDQPSLSLAAFQRELLSRGEASFNPDGRHPLTYFKMLLLAGLFEQATYFLIKTVHFTVGVHFAVVLEYYGLIHTHEDAAQELLIAVPPSASSGYSSVQLQMQQQTYVCPKYAINVGRIIRKYIEGFVRTHPYEAFHYIYLLHPQTTTTSSSSRTRNSMEADGENVDVASDPSLLMVRDLLLETRDFELLVGVIAPIGATSSSSFGATDDASIGASEVVQTSRGLLYNYYPLPSAQYILIQTARALEEHDLLVDALHCYLLAYRFDLALDHTLRFLSPLVAEPPHSPDRQRMFEVSARVHRVVRNHLLARTPGGSNLHPPQHASTQRMEWSLRALQQLRLLVNYFNLYHLGVNEYDAALSILASNELQLVPLNESEVGPAASRFTSTSMIHPAVARLLAPLALSMMEMYYTQFQAIKRELVTQHQMYVPPTRAREQNQQQRLHSIRSQARALVSFLGLVPATMQVDADVYGKLVSLETNMAA